MKYHLWLTLPAIVIQFTITQSVFSAPLFLEDFEDGLPTAFTPNPVWSLTPVFNGLSGPGNTFELSTDICHSGTNSLRYNYMGRNGFCNTCGTYSTTHAKSGHDNVDYLLADNNEDLTAPENPATALANDGPAAEPGRIVFNKDNGFSTWEILSITSTGGGTNNQLNLKSLKPGMNGETPAINGGDNFAISRECGVDGKVGGDIDRRNDCDAGIIWFGHAERSHQLPGDSLWRRFYVRAEISSPVIHQKLHYWKFDRYILSSNNTPVHQGEQVLFGDANSFVGLQPVVTGLGVVGGEGIYKPSLGSLPALSFDRGKWYYIEEEYKAATVQGTDENGLTVYNPDGAYRLWFSESTSADINDLPALELDGLTLPPFRDPDNGPSTSFWGNVQHWTHSVGSWYIDDVIITPDGRIGPTPQTCSQTRSPKPPESQ